MNTTSKTKTASKMKTIRKIKMSIKMKMSSQWRRPLKWRKNLGSFLWKIHHENSNRHFLIEMFANAHFISSIFPLPYNYYVILFYNIIRLSHYLRGKMSVSISLGHMVSSSQPQHFFAAECVFADFAIAAIFLSFNKNFMKFFVHFI